MREIEVSRIGKAIEDACGQMATVYSADIIRRIRSAAETETLPRAQSALNMLVKNAEIAEQESIPICQDTGMVIVFLKVGQDVHFTGGLLTDAIQEGVRRGYTENYLRASVVDDPLYDRKNTKDNTPAVIHTEITGGDQVEIELMAKGFGSENKSAVRMCTPAEGEEGIIRFVLDTIAAAGPNACPPFIVGVGIGGTFDSCARLSKKALMRPLDEDSSDPRYADLERRLLQMANELNIGPMGMHGRTTALKIQIEYEPTHIAGMPCAVNMCCHVCRHAKAVI